MRISGAVALVTGANRGIGRRFTELLMERGAAKVYAAARRPELVDMPGVEVLPLDITKADSTAEAAALASDITLLVNNAGINTYTNLLSGDLEQVRLEMETHYFGTLNVVRSFAPILAANGGGAVLNVLSALSWYTHDGIGSYCAAKAAEWSLTNGIRLEMQAQGTQVTGLHVGPTDTDLMAGYAGGMNDPRNVARAGIDGIEAGEFEVLADGWSATVKRSLADDPRVFYGAAG
jgi:NAD(P)-dependent dehydrogenase (short-subunit alcohol dehydrogenase family)